MRAPLSWLRAFAPIERDAESLAELLSATGLTVDGIERPGRGISGVIVGEVRSKRPHPDADKLMLLTVFDGNGERPIVCGATNYEVGSLVPLATPGGTLPGGMEIGARKVRGELSEGMLCSARELGLGSDHGGIMILGPERTPGEDLVAALELDDEVLVIDVLPNRPDALSILGVAREIAALDGLPLAWPHVAPPKAGQSESVAVTVEDVFGCPRYTARTIADVQGGGVSPWWLRRRLLLAGMRPIDPIVDATNHTMLELGQPLHAFDFATLEGGSIIVRSARAGETLTTLDGQKRTFEVEDLLICDGKRPVAIAGVMGGADTEVTAGTRTILLESASFAASRIARTARRLDLRSEAAQRFERGVDPRIIDEASQRCAALIAELTGGSVGAPSTQDGPGSAAPSPIASSVSRINARLGSHLTRTQIDAHLRSAGCDVAGDDGDILVTPPTFRPDLALPVDLDEEVARFERYDNIPSTLPLGARVGGLTAAQLRVRAVREALLARGCDEAVTLSLISPTFGERLRLEPTHAWLATAQLTNPLSADESVLRPSLLPGVIEAVRRNVSRRVTPVQLFEIGTTFTVTGQTVEERRCLAIVLNGAAESGLHNSARSFDVFDARDLVQAALGVLGHVVTFENGALGAPFHPGRGARVMVDGVVVGLVAELDPRLADGLEISGRLALAEMDLDAITSSAPTPGAPNVGRYPSIDRDLAVVIPESTTAQSLLDVVMTAGEPLLESVDVFDRFAGAQVGVGLVSLALALRLRSTDRTLTDDDAGQTMASIEAAIAAMGWTIRA